MLLPTRASAERIGVSALLAWLLACLAAPVRAQNGYVHEWFTVDGGGLTLSTSGAPQDLRVSGTAGQPDAGLLTGGIYRLVGGFWGGAYRAVTTVENDPVPIAAFRALSPSPNPARGRVTFAMDLPSEREVTVLIFDLSGRLTRTLLLGRLGPGRHTAVWDGRTEAGARAAAGIYFTRIRAGEFIARGRVVLLDES